MSSRQNVSQPCYLRTGQLPLDTAMLFRKPTSASRSSTAKQTVYNSGLIRYEGVRRATRSR